MGFCPFAHCVRTDRKTCTPVHCHDEDCPKDGSNKCPNAHCDKDIDPKWCHFCTNCKNYPMKDAAAIQEAKHLHTKRVEMDALSKSLVAKNKEFVQVLEFLDTIVETKHDMVFPDLTKCLPGNENGLKACNSSHGKLQELLLSQMNRCDGIVTILANNSVEVIMYVKNTFATQEKRIAEQEKRIAELEENAVSSKNTDSSADASAIATFQAQNTFLMAKMNQMEQLLFGLAQKQVHSLNQ